MRRTIRCAFLFSLIPLAAVLSQPGWDAVGPYGGYIRSLAKDVSGNVYAGTFLGGIFKSTDNGTSWLQLYNDTLRADFRSVAVNSSGYIFGGTDGMALQRSTDGGTTWQKMGAGFFTSGTVLGALLVLPGDDLVVGALSGNDGVYRSTNNGATFSYISTGLTNRSIYALGANSAGDLFAATAGGGVFRSTDGGANWSDINTGIDPNDLIIYGLGVKSGTEIYAASGRKMYRSTNNGDTWTPQLPVALASYSGVAFATNGDVYAAATSINNAIGGGVFKSTDSGTTWTQEPGLPNIAHFALVTSGSMIYAGTEGPGVYNSNTTLSPNGTWTLGTSGMTNTHVYVLAKGIDGSLYAGTQYAGIFKSTDVGITWFNSSSGLSHESVNAIAVDPVSGNLFAATYNFKFRSTDNGASWQQVHGQGATAIECNSRGEIFAGYGGAVYHSTNSGTSWLFTFVTGVEAIADIATDGDTVYLATGVGSGFGTSAGVYRSTNNGSTYNAFNNGLTNLNVTCLAIQQPNPLMGLNELTCGDVEAGTTTGVQRNSGGAWNQTSVQSTPVENIEEAYVDAIAGLVVLTQLLFGLNGDCQYDVYGQPNQWYEPKDVEIVAEAPFSLMNLSTPSLAKGTGTSSVCLVGTNGGGIERGTNIFTSSPESRNTPATFSLQQNYPNPFNPSTTIKFELPTAGHVSLKVFDVLGREVSTLVNEQMQAGSYKRTFDAGGLTSGVYFYRLQTSDLVQTKRLILLR
jgi:photosystem II stability/assembly factor-like uncharacterized protein